MMIRICYVLALGFLTSGFIAQPSLASDTVTYRDKTIKIVVGFRAGGGYDLYARLIAHHLGRHIPGNPNVIVENKTGGASKVAANYVYNAAPRDGTVIGSFLNNIALEGVMRSDLKFNPAKFTWLGRAADAPIFGLVWHTAPAKSVAEAKKVPVILASSGATDHGTLIPWTLNRMIGTKFKVITGYRGNSATSMALEQGEVQGLGSASLDFLKARKPEWLEENKIEFLYTNDVQRNPGLPDVPTIAEFATKDEDRQVMEALASTSTLGRAYAAPPGLTKAQTRVLRQAFAETFSDPKFLEEAKKRNVYLKPMSGKEVERVASKVGSIPARIIAKIKEYTAPPATK